MDISVVITTYKRVADLERCLESILLQTTTPKEIIVIDNANDTATLNLIKTISDSFSKAGMPIIYIINTIENSLTQARTIGITRAKYDIVSFLDDDVILDKNYYSAILGCYQKETGAIGVMGYNTAGNNDTQNVKSKILFAYIKFFQVSSYAEGTSCRVLPSLCLTYPKVGLTHNIQCEWLSGASTYHRKVFEFEKPDLNLKKYSWNEDQDFSYRVFKRFPNSLYLTPFALYYHKGSEEGRNPNHEIIYMSEVYDLYLFNKNIEKTPYNVYILLKSRVGRLLLRTFLEFRRPNSMMLKNLSYIYGAPLYAFIHIKKIFRGDLKFFNQQLT